MKRYKNAQLRDDCQVALVIVEDDRLPFLDLRPFNNKDFLEALEALKNDLRPRLQNGGSHRLKYVFPE